MFDYSTLPSSKVKNSEEVMKTIKGISFTFHKSEDERLLYKELSESLGKLESSLHMHKEDLKGINEATENFILSVEEQMDIRQRINWLQCLYKVKEKLEFVQTKEQADALRLSLMSVQTCPMKIELIEELESLASSFAPEVDESLENRLMNQAIEDAGDNFNNMGTKGREFIIKEVIKTGAQNLTITKIKERTVGLATDVEKLKSISDKIDFLNSLECLPLASFTKVSAGNQDKVIDQLMNKTEWNSLLELEQIISKAHQSIVREEKFQTDKELKIGPTINVRKLFE